MFNIKIEVWGGESGSKIKVTLWIFPMTKIMQFKSIQRVFFFFFQVEKSWYFERKKKSQIGHI
jgi:hypothetical protein